MSAKFGPAGNSEAFSIKYKTTLQAPGYLEAMGLDHYEYQCGRGVKVSDKIAFALKDKAKEHNITLSLHAPYFINLATDDPEKIAKNTSYFQALKLKSVTTA
jgi:deoxyribonuclease-4